MNSISTEQEMEFSKLLDLLAAMVAKRLDQKPKWHPEEIEEIVSEVISDSDFQGYVQDQMYDVVKGMTFHVEVG